MEFSSVSSISRRYRAEEKRGVVICPTFLLSLLLCATLAGPTATAQSGPPPTSILRSSRPVLVSVSFSGNSAATVLDLNGRIQSSPTDLSSLAQLSLSARRAGADRVSRFLQRRAGSINIRYLNTVVVTQDKEAILQLYDELGYHDARVRALYTFDTLKNIATLEFEIDEGPQYDIWAVSFHGIESLPPAVRSEVEALEFIEPGSPLRVANVDLEVTRILTLLRSRGYPFASEFNRPDVAICPPEECGRARDSVALFIDPGQRYRVREVLITPSPRDSAAGPEPVSRSIMAAQYEFDTGAWYNRSQIDETRQSLYRLGVFSEVSFDTAAVDPGAGELSLRLRYALRDLNEIEGSIEASFVPRTDEPVYTAGVALRYTRRNVLGRAITFSSGGRVEARLPDFEQIEYSGDVRADIPVANFLRASLISATIGASRGTADRAGGAKLLAQRLYFSSEITWRFPRHTFITAASARGTYQENSYEGVESFILERARTEVEEATLPEACEVGDVQQDLVSVLASNVYRLQVLQGDAPALRPSEESRDKASQLEKTVILGGTILGDKRNDFFSPTSGFYFEGRGDFGITGGIPPFGEPIGTFIRLEGDARFFRQIGSGVLATRGHAGIIFQPPGFPLTPLNLRFHSGGPNSNRGWGTREMLVTSPANVIADTCAEIIVGEIIESSRRLIGGLVLIEANLEYRMPISFFGPEWIAIPFIDVGNAYFRNYSEDRDLISVGTIVKNLGVAAGLNLGYVTPAGPLRFGFGLPIYNPIDDTKFAFQLSIGHAF